MLLVAFCAAALSLVAAPARAGQIVYAHGGELWAMNDDGSGQRQLLGAAGGGVSIKSYRGGGDQALSVQPGGTGIAFTGSPGGTCGPQTSNCPALYSLLAGKLTRLTAPSASCGSVTVGCASEEENPAVTADGRVVYNRLDVASAFTCLYYCGFTGDYSEAYYSRRLDGSDAPLAWPVPAEGGGDGLTPDFEGPSASDPADPSILAYQGNFFGSGHGPATPGTSYPLDLDHSAVSPASASQPSYDDEFIYGLSFSGDGSLVADVETGNDRGIWVYPSGQSWESGAAGSYYWALEDPDNGHGEILDHYVEGLAFVGESELVFGASYNLYEIPARCWSVDPGGAEPNCHFPQDATQLTSDGSAATPDTDPAWTASTTPIAAVSSPTPTPSPTSTPGPGAAARARASHATLGGVARRRARLRFTLAAAAGARLKRIAVRLPHGLGFSTGRKRLRAGISLRAGDARKPKFKAVARHGVLTITLAKPAPTARVTIGRRAIGVSGALARKVRAGKVKRLRVVVRAIGTDHRTTRLTLRLKVR